ncbi:helix-turn-helix domain-containing protein [Aestuariispira insulae]|uniref:Transcriptional regulator with XRE-family HTH domain n=1 Tax=Aestuariispira insulae TaxID=1461337 RepID=A0A3D9HW17_9PROT|nr:helix-turn-helix transcriptional regulator [Aestuariispira insulae]RED53704.1 transcriptional regulator with XRE-family HTH domain [Aestuariispira insulae]
MPHPTDVFVGRKVREARALRGMSQEQLAAHLGVSFQQVQKYEKGTNRIGSSRLWDISQAVEQPISFFFDGLNDRSFDQPVELSASAIKLAKKIADMPSDARRPLLNFLNVVMD